MKKCVLCPSLSKGWAVCGKAVMSATSMGQGLSGGTNPVLAQQAIEKAKLTPPRRHCPASWSRGRRCLAPRNGVGARRQRPEAAIAPRAPASTHPQRRHGGPLRTERIGRAAGLSP